MTERLMRDQPEGPLATPQRTGAETNDFYPASPYRQSAGLVDWRSDEDADSEAAVLVDRPSSNEDMLQFVLALESSRQEMETYNRYLDQLVHQSAKARVEAEAAARMKSDFLATMSHEMRTPLNGILGMAAVLLSRQLGERERDYVDTIRQAGESLRALVDDVLDLSKIEAGQLRLDLTDFELTRVVSDALQIVETLVAQKPLKIVTHYDKRLPRFVRADSTRIRQILLNLLSNAIKFTAQGTIEIHSRVQFVDDRECEILFSVKDDGIGITEDQQHRLFRPFSQAEDSTARKYGGTGLGLAICKRLAERMGGQIGVTSRPGHGSLFWFTVRVLVAQEPRIISEPEAPSIPPRQHQPRNARVLLVEDNKINQKVATLMLKNLGYPVNVASNGVEALNALDEEHYDLILMDCMMPEMDGFEATRRLREMGGQGASVPVIAMTASAFDDDRLACMSAGMNDFISKPVCEYDLGTKLEFWLAAEQRKSLLKGLSSAD
jgi:signal transduction histidine kinase/ActR/RegA family two-component response regulator